jgi:hypothetical protein
VRINDGNAMSGLNVLQNQIAEQGRFTSTTFSNGVKMMPAVVVRKTECLFLTPHFTNAYDNLLCHDQTILYSVTKFSPDLYLARVSLFGDMRFFRAAKVIEVRLETRF